MPTQSLPTFDAIPASVLQLAERLGVTDKLDGVVEMTRDVFPDYEISLEATQDYECESEWWITVVVQIPDEANFETEVERNSIWAHRIFECCPAPLSCSFTIFMKWDS